MLSVSKGVRVNSDVAPFSITCLGTGKMPVPQENSSLVEWAGEPVLDNGARFKIK
jgi:hypothetical protein